ncbi:MAG: cytochrome c oxidase subunit 3 [Actinomycetota bacterium]|nr:cytochrome c oxidase subunit 3 [Actinomycetota bacterium]
MSVSPGQPGEIGAGLNVRTDPAAARADDLRQLTANLSVGARLTASATAFVFMSFLFAFLYLRTVDSNGLWRPKHVSPVQSWGIAVLVLTVLSAVALDLARRSIVAGLSPRWRTLSLLALALGTLVVVAQGLEYATITFKTADGGWAAVFWGWTVVQLAFWLGALYWLETLVAQTLRRPPAAPRLGTAGNELLRPSADACAVFLYTLAIVAVIAYVLLYLVK